MLKKAITYILILFFIIGLLNVGVYSREEMKEDDVFKKAVRYFFQKKLEMAEMLFQDELKKNPENALAYSYLGDIFFTKGRYDGALRLYRRALEINPNAAEDYFRIGQIYYHKKDGSLAIENFEKSYKLDPNLKFAYYHIGLTYLMLMRDKQNTIESWENFLSVAPEDPQYGKIRRVIELLRDPNFIIPPQGSDITIEEALHLGGVVLKDAERRAKEKKAGHEDKKTKHKLEDIYRDDAL